MVRNQVTTVSKLSPGDCFYKAGDEKKKTFARLEEAETEITFAICPTENYKGRFQNQRTEKLKEDITVVFLRQIK